MNGFSGRSGLAGGPLAGGLTRLHPVASPGASSAGATFRGLRMAASSSDRSGGRSGGRGQGEGIYGPSRGGGRSGGRGGGGGRNEGRYGPGRDGGRMGGRGGGGARPEDLAPDDPASARDLGTLEKLVLGNAAAWKANSNTRRLSRAISVAVKLSSRSADDFILLTRILETLAAAYLPLVPRLRGAVECIIPLYACARAGYWGPASADGKGGLAVALLQRLSADGCALLRPDQTDATDQSHSNLWLALSEALKSAEGRQVLSSIDLPPLLESSAECLLGMTELAPQACSNVLLASARLQWRNGRLAHHMTACLAENSYKAKNQELANTLYAVGELAEDLGHKPRREDLQSIVRVATKRLASADGAAGFVPLDFANMLLGCAKLGFKGSMVRPLVVAAGQAARQMNAQQLANTVWAVAKSDLADQRWYAVAVEAAGQEGAMQGADAHAWSNLWYALALARHRPASSSLVEWTAEAAAGVLSKEANPQDCANLLWALATLRLSNEVLVDALAGRLGKLLGQDPKPVKTQLLCNSLWALAVMGPDVLSRHSGLVEGLLREAERRWAAEGSEAFSEQGLTQVWQVQVELAHAGAGELQPALGTNKGSLLSSARAAALSAARLAASSPPTALEAEVASALDQLQQRMGPGAIASLQRRCMVEGLGRMVEAVVELAGGQRVAVETVGRYGFFANTPHDHMQIGPVALFVRQLQYALGVGSIVSVPYWDWKNVKNEGRQLSYLSRRLGLGEP